MKKSLSELSLEELWGLFPIDVTEYSESYTEQYERELENLTHLCGKAIARINHIGSTAVKNLAAKPIVDILMEGTESTDIPALIHLLTENGWLLISESAIPPMKLSFNKGYTEDGFADEVFHLHVRYKGDWGELYFRDYLKEHTPIAQEYAQLKLNLMEIYRYDRDAYTEAKTEFVEKYTAMARKAYRGRYSA